MSLNSDYKRIKLKKLSFLEKLTLIKSVMTLVDRNEDWLMPASKYLIDEDLIYTVDNSVDDNVIRLLFYPDYKEEDYNKKLTKFIRCIFGRSYKPLTDKEGSIVDDLIRLGNENKLGVLRETLDRALETCEEDEAECETECCELTRERLETLFYNALTLLFEEYGHATYDDLAERLGLTPVEEAAMDLVYEGETSFFDAYDRAFEMSRRNTRKAKGKEF